MFEGGESFLSDHDRWFIKTEFAPMWLQSQKTDPVALLRELLRCYTVYEAPGRILKTCTHLAEAMERILNTHPGRVLVVEPNCHRLPESWERVAQLVHGDEALARADVLVLLVDHKEFKALSPTGSKARYLVDTRGIWG